MKTVKYCIALVSVLLLLSAPAYAAAEFPDVPEGSYTAEALEFLCSRDIVHGYEDGSFRPENPVSRAEFAVMLCNLTGARSAESASAAFPDTEDHWAESYIAAAAERGYLNGSDDGLFHPNEELTFEQAVAVAMKILCPEEDFSSQEAWYQGYMDRAVSGGYTRGMHAGIGLQLSRGDLAILFYNISTHFADDYLSFSFGNQNTGYVYRDFTMERDSPYTICITSDTMGNEHLRQTIAAEPNTRYIISADVRTENVVASDENSRVEGICLSAQAADGLWNVSANLHGTNDWTTLRLIGISDENGELPFDLNLGGGDDKTSSGTGWFDNVAYIKVADYEDPDPTWRFLAVILRSSSLDVTDEAAEGGELHLSHTMEDRHIRLIEETLEQLEEDFTALSNGKIRAQFDVIAPEAVMDAYERGTYGYNIPGEAAYAYCQENGIDISQYDHVYFISCLPDMPAEYFGLGGTYIQGCTGYSEVYFHSGEYIAQVLGEGWYWTSSVFIHEFLHSMETYSETLGYPAAVLHDGEKYRYQEKPNYWKEYYTDFLNQEILYEGENIGVDEQVLTIKPHVFYPHPAET